jgi:tetratricopeptide (TPR) repeat protein
MSRSTFNRIVSHVLDAYADEHIAEQKAALAANPEWAEGHYNLAHLYRTQGRQREAKEQLLIVLEKQPTLAEAHTALGEIYILEGDLASARQYAEFAAALGNRRLLDQMQRYGADGED